jgi:outer membrane murein-binding lipoprotein Lpp
MMHGSEVTVTSDPRRKIDELASELDDLTTTVEELEIETTNEGDAAELRRLQRALEEASDAADVVDDKLDDLDDLDGEDA